MYNWTFLLKKWIYALSVWVFCIIAHSHPDLGQSLIVGFEGTKPHDAEVRQVCTLLKEKKVRGIILFTHNIRCIDQLQTLVQYIKSHAPQTIVMIDQEGGAVRRLKPEQGFPINMPSAQDYKSPEEAYNVFLQAGKAMKEIGIDINLAPVLDVNINPASPAIGAYGRSFSKDPNNVIAMGRACLNGMRDAGISGCCKHFPGHGSAKQDSHMGFTDISDTYNPNVELQPFQTLKKETPFIMVAHTFCKKIDPNNPASLSSATYRLLPHYKGKYITDDYFMKAVSDRYSAGAFARKALEAGAHFLIFGRNLCGKATISLKDFVEKLYAQYDACSGC